MQRLEQGAHKEEEGRREKMWLDLDTGTIGFGATYGENSFNNRPLRAIYGEEAIRKYLEIHGVRRETGQDLNRKQ